MSETTNPHKLDERMLRLIERSHALTGAYATMSSAIKFLQRPDADTIKYVIGMLEKSVAEIETIAFNIEKKSA